MASKESCLSSESDPSGYKYEFIDKIPEDLLCQRCKHVARDPNLTSCCTESFCKDCISPYLHDNQPCPSCSDKDFVMFLNKKIQKKIQSMLLFCPMKSHGCEWTGQLEQLEGHMDVQSGDCLYVDVECPSHCDQKIRKRNIQNHLSRECPLREYTCPHCNFKASYKVVSEDHLEVCSYLPVQCPNRCGVTCEREDLEDHMKICDKEELECCFSHAGCQGRFLREDEERHMEENTKKHLSLMATTMLKISKEMEKQELAFQERFEQQKIEFQERLREEHQEHAVKLLREKLQEQEDKLAELRYNKEKLQEEEPKHQEQEVKLLREKLQEQDRKFQDKLQEQEDKLAELQYNIGYVFYFPVTFTMPFFEQIKTTNRDWCSPVMYTEFRGYSFRICAYPNGPHNGTGHGTHVSVGLLREVGSYDAQLKWPVTVTVSIQLLNQHADKDHVTREISWKYNKKDTTGTTIWIVHKFISHKELDWNAEKETQYLKNNSLQFKVVKVEVKD